MSTIHCHKIQSTGTAFDFPPIPGPLGERIQAEISQEAWQLWLEHQTILINEYRLNLLETAAKEFLRDEMMKFLFENDDSKPDAFVPLDDKKAK